MDVTEGEILFQGQDISRIAPRKMRPFRREMQMIFQDPYASLNPRHTVGSIIGAPFHLHGTVPKNRIKEEVRQLMELVGLNRSTTTGTRTSSPGDSASASAWLAHWACGRS